MSGATWRKRGGLDKAVNGALPLLCWSGAALIVCVCVSMIVYLLWEGAPSLDWEFLTTDPVATFTESLSGGVRAPIAGTVIMLVLSTLLVVPPALMSATYLAEYMRDESPVTKAVRFGLEALAGVPSIVFGIFALAFFAHPAFIVISDEGADSSRAFGASFIIGAIVMTIHILPFVIKVMEEAIRGVPGSYREAAAALGMTKWAAIRRVILPSAAPGLMTAIILGMGLVAGDTAIIKLAVGNSMEITGATEWWLPQNWWAVLKGQGSTLTTFTWYSSPAGEGSAPTKAFGAAFLLILIVVVLNVAVEVLMRQKQVKSESS